MMGYFPNGTSGMMYEEEYCNRCVHQEKPCAVWNLHMNHNYEECNKKESYLHYLIPRDKDGFNKKCTMFIPKSALKITEKEAEAMDYRAKQYQIFKEQS